MSSPHNAPRPPSPSRCRCGGALVLSRVRPSTPLVPACASCGTPSPAAAQRLANL